MVGIGMVVLAVFCFWLEWCVARLFYRWSLSVVSFLILVLFFYGSF